jgi:hypothetical protein
VKASGLSRRAFSKEFGVGEQVLLRLSQGRSTKVPPSIENAIEEAVDIETIQETVREFGAGNLQEAYDIWRTEQQSVGQLPDKITSHEGSPAQRLAAEVGSMSRLAKILHVHDYVVRRYVQGITKELPQSMRDSMQALGWRHTDALDNAQQHWLEQHAE